MTLQPPPDPTPAPPRDPPRRIPLISASGGWRTALREFAVIVAGVLAALAGQAWWEGSQARQREAQYLAQLMTDTRENARRLEEAVARDSVADLAMGHVMRVLHGTRPLPPDDTLSGWLGRAMALSDYKPVTGTYDALLATGDLRVLRNDSLRSALVSYKGSLDGEVVRLHHLRLATLDQVPSMARALPFMTGALVRGLPPADPDFERLRADPNVRAALFAMQAVQYNRLSGLRRARDETARFQRVLDAEPALAGQR